MDCFAGPGVHATVILEKRSRHQKYWTRLLASCSLAMLAYLTSVVHANKRYCERKQSPFVTMDYYFQSWWMTHIVKMTLAYQPIAGPQFNLATLRRVPDGSQCFLLAMEGDIDGVRSLMIAGQASTKDVAATTWYTMLTWSVIKKQSKMAEFLLKADSDPHHDPSGIQP